MSKAIKVTGVSKLYRVGVKDELHDTATKTVASFIKSPLKNYRKYRSLTEFDDVDFATQAAEPNVLWALRDVSFELERGDIVGVIGGNGAGKSTLLKVLSRITPPTRGRVEISGRLYSLLEAGTGFHPELTGRENVYLNGTILGMKKPEIDRKFDEIVAFSGIERFIDTPAKRYSSGMTVRLAFAVAAHLEPEILIVDEVLAVGDAAFQKKCLSKMQDVGKLGATILFVSHSMPSITRLCSKGILLQNGCVIKSGPVHKVVSAYRSSGLAPSASKEWLDEKTAPQSDVVRLRAIRVVNQRGTVVDAVDVDEAVGIQAEFEVLKEGHELLPHFYLDNDEGVHILPALDVDPEWHGKPRRKGRFVTTGWIPKNFLAAGTFSVVYAIITQAPIRSHVYLEQVVTVKVNRRAEDGDADPLAPGNSGGVIAPVLDWTTEYLPFS